MSAGSVSVGEAKMKSEIAQQISQEMVGIMGKLEALMHLVMDNCTEDEFKSFRTATGRVMGAIVLDVMNPLYEKNPEVKPEIYWDENGIKQDQV